MKTVINIESFEPFVEYCRAHLETQPNDLFIKKTRKEVLGELMECRNVNGQSLPYFITKFDIKMNTEKYQLFNECNG